MPCVMSVDIVEKHTNIQGNRAFEGHLRESGATPGCLSGKFMGSLEEEYMTLSLWKKRLEVSLHQITLPQG